VTTILLSAGDLSGERHAAALVARLRERMPQARFVGMGGAAMAAAGVELAVDQRELAVGGLLEVVGGLPGVVRAWRGLSRCLRETRPDLVVLVDSGGFNLPFARRVRASTHAKILYYVAPQVWAWRPGRLRRLAERTDRIAVILPFEPAWYAERGVDVDFVGHPVVDAFAAAGGPADAEARVRARRDARRALDLPPDADVLGLFPGSRRNELARHLPVQLDAFVRLRSDRSEGRALVGVVGLAPSLERAEATRAIERHARGHAHALRLIRVDEGRVLDACDVAVAKPGTITVELMLRRTPMVVVGRAHPVSVAIARRRLGIDRLAMPNLIANAGIVPELLQGDARGDRIAAALAPLFRGDARSRQIEALDAACRRLGGPGAARRTAGIVEEMLGTVPA
jgi:lipid-A-disaccharide synthase